MCISSQTQVSLVARSLDRDTRISEIGTCAPIQTQRPRSGPPYLQLYGVTLCPRELAPKLSTALNFIFSHHKPYTAFPIFLQRDDNE